MSVMPEVAIIGAGPYGLSVAAHLRARGVGFRIFGIAMQSWRTKMPEGMCLKSEGFASNLYDRSGQFTLERYCAQNGLPYGDHGVPVPLATMTAYGLAFQKRMVPELEERMVERLDPAPNGFLLRLADGETVAASTVVIATGITYFHYVPPSFASLPAEFLSHSSKVHDLSQFKGRDVTVIGAGASALDTAGLLHEAGAETHVVARRRAIQWTDEPYESKRRSLWQRVRYPISGMGPGLRSKLYEELPMLFRYLPEQVRLEIVKTFLGPAPPWFMKDRVVGRVSLHLGCVLGQPEIRGGRVHLPFIDGDGVKTERRTDHIIAATGYRVDLRRLPFLDQQLLAGLRAAENTPVLSANFESTIPGLYFVGLPSANTFGPLMRFMLGAGYTSRRLSAHIAQSIPRRLVSRPPATVSHAQT
jgi:thioredoxin reductase